MMWLYVEPYEGSGFAGEERPCRWQERLNCVLCTATNETVTLGGTVAILARGMDHRHRMASLTVMRHSLLI